MEALTAGITFVDSENGRQYKVFHVKEDALTDDASNRYIVGPISWREGKLALTFSDVEGDPHGEARYVASALNFRREEVDGESWVVSDLDWDTDELALEAKRLVDEGRITGVSIHPSEGERFLLCGAPPKGSSREQIEALSAEFDPDSCEIENWVEAWVDLVISSSTLLMNPAFADAKVVVAASVDEIIKSQIAKIKPIANLSDLRIPDLTNAEIDAFSAAISDIDLMRPPSDWFAIEETPEPTHIIVTEEGQVYGHLTEKDCHRGFFDQCVLPPDDAANFEEFHNNGTVYLDNGETLRVGNLTIDLNHADVRASADKAKAHYDNSGAVVAQVRASQGKFGIWLSGALAPWATPEQVEKLKRLRLSGDWRPTRDGRHFLIAAQAVAVPGFPIRAKVASGMVEEYTTLGPENPTDALREILDSPSDLALVASAIAKTNDKLDEIIKWKREQEYRETLAVFD